MNIRKHKPKGRTPSLISLNNGNPKKAEVRRKSICTRCKRDIESGVDCFEISRIISGFKQSRRYCKICFTNIIQQTEKDLEKIKNLM